MLKHVNRKETQDTRNFHWHLQAIILYDTCKKNVMPVNCEETQDRPIKQLYGGDHFSSVPKNHEGPWRKISMNLNIPITME
jgi:hypothetical protein